MIKSVQGFVVLSAVLVLIGPGSGFVSAGGLFAPVFDPVQFSNPLDINNMYWPLVPGTTFRYFAESEDDCEVAEVSVTNAMESIAGVQSRVVVDEVWVDEDCDGNGDFLSEYTLDWYAQDDDGNVWYMGEFTTSYPGGDHEGSWTAGEGGAEAGIIMPADPVPGLFYRQEYLEGQAEDMGKVLRVDASLDSCDDGLVTKEWTKLATGEIEHKYYCPGVGLVLVEELKGKTVMQWLVEVVAPAP